MGRMSESMKEILQFVFTTLNQSNVNLDLLQFGVGSGESRDLER